jgi:hypothetical protein
MQELFHKVATPLIVVICGDAGGANAVAPVIEALRGEGCVSVKALAYRQACALWTKRGIDYQQIEDSITHAEIDSFLLVENVVLLLTGTSFYPSLENKFVAAARENGLLSLAILDYWSHYGLRFSDTDGNLVYMPDRIAVMDKMASDGMLAAGFDPSRIIITGHPAFDSLTLCRSAFTSANRKEFRDELGVRPEELLVLFASQWITYLQPKDPFYPGFCRESILLALINALDEIAEQKHCEIALVIRPHPREMDESFEFHSRAIRVLVSRTGETRDLALASDLVTGISSVFLVESCYLGCLTVSLQPGLRLPDALPTNHLGFSRPVYREEEIKSVLEDLLFDKEVVLLNHARLASLQMDGRATERVMSIIYQMIGLEHV